MSDSRPVDPESESSIAEIFTAETRASIEAFARALSTAGKLDSLGEHITAAARACVNDARCRTSRAEQLVLQLKQVWYRCAELGGVPRHLSNDAMERLVTASIHEYYRVTPP